MSCITVSVGEERARLFREGGTGYEVYVRGLGWVTEESPSPLIEMLAAEVRERVFRGCHD